MSQPPLDNQTDFAAHPQLLLDRDGEKLVTIVKATFELPPGGGPLDLAPPERKRGIRFADVPWGKPEVSSILYPADVCLRKPGTDVIVVARAYAPGGKPVPSFDVHVRVGPLEKRVRVFGLRVWEEGGAGLSSPRPVAEMDMRYDHAWGGAVDADPARFIEEPRNPVGTGIAGDPRALTHKPGPSIEDPEHLISSFRTRPPPAGIGPIGRHWEPRRRYAGTYDEPWLDHRAPLPPEDMDDRFNHCASPGLVADHPLSGGEAVALLNLVPGGGATAFTLPKVSVAIEFRVKDREPEVIVPHLDTVVLDLLETGPDKPIAVELVWRAFVRAPRRMKDARVTVREREVAA
jgi:hypothetical protein